MNRDYQFVVTVRGASSLASARTAILVAFSSRQLDGCEFHLKRKQRGQWFNPTTKKKRERKTP